jgi:hypothetical protein
VANISTFFKLLEKKSIFIFSAILFKIILEYTYINNVNPIYDYSGFILDISFIKYLEGWLIYSLFLSFTPHILEKTSDFIINNLLFTFLTPLLVFYSLSNAARENLYIVLGGILIIYLFRKGKKIKLPIIKYGHNYAYLLCFLSVVSTSLWLVFSGGLNFFNLDFTRVYEFRGDVEAVISTGLMGYLNTWAFKVFGPFLLIIFLSSRKYFFASLVFLLHLFWFGVSSHKAVLFVPFVIIFIYMWFRNNKGLSIIPISLTLVISFSYFFFIIFDNNLYGSLFIRRLFFVPSFLTFTYYDFFSNEQFIFWSNSITSKFIEYPFNLLPAKLIGAYLGIDANANNSFLSTGYMHAGIVGILFYSIIFTLILRLFDSIVYNQKFIWISVAIIITPIRSMITSTDLPTALLTHGVFISLVLTVLYRYKFK